MSIRTNIDKLDYDSRQKINTDLKITIPGMVSKYVFPYNIVNDDIYVATNAFFRVIRDW